MSAFKDLTGQRFGRLAVQRSAGSTNRGQALWECICDCGTVRIVVGEALRSGNTRSCGCLQRERCSSHRMTRSRTYKSWHMMLQRCLNPKNTQYSYYGGRGISVCERWLNSFENFLADMGERPPGLSIDRFPDPDGNYEPTNCRWATPKEQRANQRPRKEAVYRSVA